MDHFSFFCPTYITFGSGVRKDITQALKENAWKRVGLVIDHNLRIQESIFELIDSVKDVSDNVVTGWCAVSEPTYDHLEAMRKQYMDQDMHAIIGIGGGSAIDMAKAMAVLVHNLEPAIQYRGFNKMTEPVLPVIAVPTTAGTGSEVTPNASFIDSTEKKKLGINGEAVRPLYAFLDPQFTLSCPKAATISAGVDSMVHAVEAFAAKKTNQLARFFATEGFRRVFYALPKLITDLGNIELRQEVMYGAFLSGVALMHSGTGPAAALSYPLSVHFKVPHGLGGGVFLPSVVEHNVRHGYTEYASLLDLGISDGVKAAESFLQEINATWKKLGIPGNLGMLGVKTTDADLIVKETMELKGALDQNPVPFYEKEIADTINRLTAETHD
ncbi:MAG: iron-containing alcohol dehydrogenase [Desulfobacteraceae bacterium]|nr:MAG: iron-containing alcohol dehydrogenase [Desulfobacteraceae bacterium]